MLLKVKRRKQWIKTHSLSCHERTRERDDRRCKSVNSVTDKLIILLTSCLWRNERLRGKSFWVSPRDEFIQKFCLDHEKLDQSYLFPMLSTPEWVSLKRIRLLLEFQLVFYIYFKMLKKRNRLRLKNVLKSNRIVRKFCGIPWITKRSLLRLVKRRRFWNVGKSHKTVFHSRFFCRFSFKSIKHEVDNLVSASRRILSILSRTQ